MVSRVLHLGDCECDVIRDRVLLGLFVILVLLDGVSVEAKQLS